MPGLPLDGATIEYEEAGEGDPLVLVHGSWGEAAVWQQVVPLLSGSFRVIAYDRRGHGRSSGEGPLDNDAEDLAGIIESLAGGRAHVAANSLGAVIALRLAGRRPELFRTLAVHEPPLMGLVADDPVVMAAGQRLAGVIELLEADRNEEAAHRFADEVALGPGAWDAFPDEERERMVRNAQTFLEENREPDLYHLDVASLASFSAPALLSGGTESPPFFGIVLGTLEGALPDARRQVLDGAGHVPHMTHPEPYAAMLLDFAGES